jgi:regulatory protein
MGRKYSPEETRLQIARWVDRCERCHREVCDKLNAWGVPPAEHEDLLAQLISGNALNEQRYALAFASDHFRFHGWGPFKIAAALRAKGISQQLVQLALASLDAAALRRSVVQLAQRKFDTLRDGALQLRRKKTAQFLVQKGFEPDMVWETVGSLT